MPQDTQPQQPAQEFVQSPAQQAAPATASGASAGAGADATAADAVPQQPVVLKGQYSASKWESAEMTGTAEVGRKAKEQLAAHNETQRKAEEAEKVEEDPVHTPTKFKAVASRAHLKSLERERIRLEAGVAVDVFFADMDILDQHIYFFKSKLIAMRADSLRHYFACVDDSVAITAFQAWGDHARAGREERRLAKLEKQNIEFEEEMLGKIAMQEEEWRVKLDEVCRGWELKIAELASVQLSEERTLLEQWAALEYERAALAEREKHEGAMVEHLRVMLTKMDNDVDTAQERVATSPVQVNVQLLDETFKRPLWHNALQQKDPLYVPPIGRILNAPQVLNVSHASDIVHPDVTASLPLTIPNTCLPRFTLDQSTASNHIPSPPRSLAPSPVA